MIRPGQEYFRRGRDTSEDSSSDHMGTTKQYAYTEARQEVLKALKAAIGKTYSPTFEELADPPEPSMGDIAFPCFGLAKGLKRNPAEISRELAAKIGSKGMIKGVRADGPYVNFMLDPVLFGEAVIKEVIVSKSDYGKQNIGKGRKIMVEYVNYNTHKEVHIGHLRNAVVGHLTINLLRSVGYDVIAASYINDLGNNVARCLWALDKFHEHEKPEKGDEINFLGRMYTEATHEAEDNDEARAEISEIQRQLETKRGKWNKLWKETRKWSIDAMYAIFKELKLPIDKQYYESEILERTADIVRDLQDKGIAKVDDGAIIVDLEDEDLGVNLLVKTDGTMLYNAKDLGLAQQKNSDYTLDRSMIVVDERQSLAMRQLFATLKRMDVHVPYEHLSYNFVTLPDGAMSSRKGNFIRYEELRDMMREAAAKETRERHNDWKENQVQDTAKGIAHAAMVYTMAKQDPKKDIVFDTDAALSFEGMSGPYILYTATRIKSLLKRTKIKPKFHESAMDNLLARQLVQMIASFPHVVLQSANNLHLSDVPQYVFDLSALFSSYYGDSKIIDEEDTEGTAGRLALCRAVLVTLENAMAIMNIEPLKEM